VPYNRTVLSAVISGESVAGRLSAFCSAEANTW